MWVSGWPSIHLCIETAKRCSTAAFGVGQDLIISSSTSPVLRGLAFNHFMIEFPDRTPANLRTGHLHKNMYRPWAKT